MDNQAEPSTPEDPETAASPTKEPAREGDSTPPEPQSDGAAESNGAADHGAAESEPPAPQPGLPPLPRPTVKRWERLDAALLRGARVGRALLSPWFVLLLVPLLLGSAYWYYSGGQGRLKALDTNKVKLADQLGAVRMAGNFLLLIGGTVGAVYAAYRVKRGAPLAAIVARASAFVTPLLAAPFVVALMQDKVEKESPKLTLFFCAIIAGILGTAAYRLSRSPRGTDAEAASPRDKQLNIAYEVVAWASVLGLWVAYGWFFTRLSITNHHALMTRTIDLGLYDNIFYQSSHGHPLGCTFLRGGTHGSAHFDPILVLMSPLYRLYPRAEFILALQSIWVGSGVVPVFLIARRQLGSRLHGVLLAIVYALHPALHGANMYEFHSLTLACVPILWTLYFLERKWLKLYWVALVVALLVREDIPLMMTMVGLTVFLGTDAQLRRHGLVTMIFSLAYFVLVKGYFMTSSGVIMSGPQAYSYAYYYSEMIPDPEHKNLVGLVLSLLTNPTFALRHAMEEVKVVYLIKMFLPLIFVPFAARNWRLILAYGIAFTTLATREAVFSTHFQYSNTILPFAFFALPVAIKQMSDGRFARAYSLEPARYKHALVVGTLAAGMTVSWKFGGVVDNQAFYGGFTRVVRKLTPEQEAHYKWMEEAVAMIPLKASLGVTNKIGPHVSNRKDVYFYGQKNVQYVFVDERELKQDRLKKHKDAIRDGQLKELTRRGSYALFKYVPKPKKEKEKVVEEVPEVQEGSEDVQDVLGDDPRE
ncbi:MAG: DUF2079 domain-containing protein [Polyangiaceae bacterium]